MIGLRSRNAGCARALPAFGVLVLRSYGPSFEGYSPEGIAEWRAAIDEYFRLEEQSQKREQ